MQFSTHGNGKGLDDLYVLPENAREREIIGKFLSRNAIHATLCGQFGKNTDDPWKQQTFFDIPFGEGFKEAIIKEVTK